MITSNNINRASTQSPCLGVNFLTSFFLPLAME